jgi:hypothetical protein
MDLWNEDGLIFLRSISVNQFPKYISVEKKTAQCCK